MTLKCTVDGRPEGPDHVISVCHHCGRPLCEEHGLVISADDAFDDSGEEPDRRTAQSGTSAVKRPQPAMHCKQCLDESHPRARWHYGWADPREAQRTPQAQAQAWPQPGQQQVRATGRS